MTDAVIYIPTFQRTARQLTWNSISDSWRQNTLLVANAEEGAVLKRAGYPVLVHPAWVDNIATKRQWIFEWHHLMQDEPYAVMFDDDLRFHKRRDDDPGKFLDVRSIPGEFDRMMHNLLDLLRETPLAGIRNRSGANRDYDEVLWDRRQHDVIAVDTQVMMDNDFRLDRTTLMEDFDFVLQYLTAGYSNALLNTHCEDDVGGRAGNGGCTSERSMERQREAAEWLVNTWPDFVKTRKVQAKGDGPWSERVDVTVQWKKARGSHG